MTKKITFIAELPLEQSHRVDEWVKNNCNGTYVILQNGYDNQFKSTSYTIRDIIPTNSPLEEYSYKLTDKLFEKITHPHKKYLFEGVNILKDLLYSPSLIIPYYINYGLAIQNLLKKYDHVILVERSYASYHISVLRSLSSPALHLTHLLRWNPVDQCLCPMNLQDFILKKTKCLFLFYKKLLKDAVKSLCIKLKRSDPEAIIVPTPKLEDTKRTAYEENIPKGFPFIFLSTSAALYRNNFKPIYEEMKTLSGFNLPVITSEASLDTGAHEDGYPIISLEKEAHPYTIKSFFNLIFSSFHFYNRLIFFVIALKKKNRHHLSHRIFINIIIYACVCTAHLYINNSFIYISRLSDYIRKKQPNCLYKDTICSTLSIILEGLSQKYNIPVVTSMHASFSEKYRDFVKSYTNYITIIGEEQITPLLKRGFKRHQIICAGQAELQNIKKIWSKDESISFLQKEYNITPAQKNILIATSSFDRKNEKRWIETLANATGTFEENTQIFLKPHSASGNFYDSLKNCPHLTILPFECPLYPLFQIANLVITDVSHAGKLAIYFEKNLLIVNCSGKKFPYNTYEDFHVCDTAYHENEMLTYVKQYLKQDGLRKKHYPSFIQHHFTSNDDQPATRIAQFILNVGTKANH